MEINVNIIFNVCHELWVTFVLLALMYVYVSVCVRLFVNLHRANERNSNSISLLECNECSNTTCNSLCTIHTSIYIFILMWMSENKFMDE